MKKIIPTFFVFSFMVSGVVWAQNQNDTPHSKITPEKQAFQALPFTDVKLEDKFWRSRLETNREVSIPHNYKWCEETGRFDNFAKAGGLMQGEFRGIYFNDSDVYKLIEGTAYSLADHPDPKLEAAADKVIDWIAAAQEKNGYINTYYTLKEPDKKWSNTPVMHELYCIGHMTEAAVAYQRATGKDTLLNVAEKAIDHVASVFGDGEGKKREVPGHEEIELALVKLYELTGKKKYIELSKFFINMRGNKEQRTNNLHGLYSQDHKPVREQDEVVGHAVRAMYLYAGMTDIAAYTGDEGLINAVDKLWDNVVHKKMYITGGIGARHEGEAFGENYEMPNDTAYCETCAQIGLTFWAQRMNLLHGGAEYADIVERELYNGVISGYALQGDKFFYPNPLSSRGGYGRQPFFDCACCPTNVVRFVPSIPGYVYATRENTIIVNQYVASVATIELPDGQVTIKQENNYPWDGKLTFICESKPNKHAAEKYTLNFRIPGWSEEDGETAGYIDPVQVRWGDRFVQKVEFPMPVKRMVAHPSIKSDNGRVALQRGPIVYCFEQCDNPDIDFRTLTLAKKQDFKIEWLPKLLGGVNIIKCQDVNGKELIAVPYYAWAHRDLTGMDVWVQQEGLPRKPKLNADTWKGKLYRPLSDEMYGESEPLTIYDTTTVTSSHCHPTDSEMAAFDGLEPENSNDHAIPRLTWWSHLGSKENTTLAFAEPPSLTSLGVYWFDDTPKGGCCRVPESWSLSYKNNAGEWVQIQTDDKFAITPNKYNTVTFDAIKTSELRIDVKLQEKFSGGILEVKLN